MSPNSPRKFIYIRILLVHQPRYDKLIDSSRKTSRSIAKEGQEINWNRVDRMSVLLNIECTEVEIFGELIFHRNVQITPRFLLNFWLLKPLKFPLSLCEQRAWERERGRGRAGRFTTSPQGELLFKLLLIHRFRSNTTVKGFQRSSASRVKVLRSHFPPRSKAY